ncbi:HalOD1 output domain-containing protein [Natrinema ejinorense]|uniref:Halobacterial output domain-containing protein n=1 Tax=Natrinema ejinorense TaxID=373386 RepID=A0A2A5QQX8_9EURY|nr:HalOD1 output domain-containing protein [Natrinema ejinorense]PCR89247.1 hypothetical protein CP557_01050 [Natrinema ejinorense]
MTRHDGTSTANSPGDGSDSEPYTARYDWDGTDLPSSSIVRTVAAVTGMEPADMRPLYDVVDAEAVDRLFTRTRGRARPERLSFRFEDCDVTVHGDGRVVVAV